MGIVSGIPGDAQKQASADAAGVRRKRNGETPCPSFKSTTYLFGCQKTTICPFFFHDERKEVSSGTRFSRFDDASKNMVE
jgi:hypothetical protein